MSPGLMSVGADDSRTGRGRSLSQRVQGISRKGLPGVSDTQDTLNRFSGASGSRRDDTVSPEK